MAALIVYMTAGSREEAEKIGASLIEKRLAACVNVLGEIDSMFHWKGEVQKETEVAFIAKTQASRLDELTAAVNEIHSYDEPCIVAYELVGGSRSFLEWIESETSRSMLA
jgi:periplasmic divalent cation tolerance protein